MIEIKKTRRNNINRLQEIFTEIYNYKSYNDDLVWNIFVSIKTYCNGKFPQFIFMSIPDDVQEALNIISKFTKKAEFTLTNSILDTYISGLEYET